MSQKISIFEIKKLKLKGIKLKYRHYLINTYKKLNKNLSENWIPIFESLIKQNNKNIKQYVNEFLLLDENVCEKDKEDAQKYILGLVNQDVINNCLCYLNLNNENSKKSIKTYFKNTLKETEDELRIVIDTLQSNNVDIIDIEQLDFDDSFIDFLIQSEKDNEYEPDEEYNDDEEDNEDEEYIDEDDEDENDEYPEYDDDYEEDYEPMAFSFLITNSNKNNNDISFIVDDNIFQKNKNTRNSNKNNTKIEKTFQELIKTREQKSNTIIDEFKKLHKEDQQSIVKDLKDINNSLDTINNLQMRVLKSKLTIHEKKELLNRIDTQGSERKGKFREYCESVLSFPFGKYAKMNTENLNTPEQIKSLLDNGKDILNKTIYGHEDAKHNIISHISQMITNPDSCGKAIGLVGTRGTGKTSLVEHGFCKILGLPFVMIGLAGLQDGSYFTGHHYTYEGSQAGKIVEGIKKAGVLNPVFFCDELDKISGTDRGVEISNKLIQMIDQSQNNHFQDTYFGNIDIDLSKALWIFTWNDSSKIDPILLDRIKIIKIKGFNLEQKMVISQDYLIPKIIKEIGIKNGIDIKDEVIKYLINSLTYEGGVRKLRELLFEIVSEFNMKCLTGIIQPAHKKRKKETTNTSKNTFSITMDNVNDFLIKKIPYEHIKIRDKNLIGNIVGLYATSNDVGGIIPISAKLVPSDVTLSLNLTGNLGKIMKESAIIAKTVAWDKTNQDTKDNLMELWKKRKEGIHIHCSEGSVGKEGPSAGTALAICLYSLFNNLPIYKDIGITGELDLTGKVLPIGGLQEKMYGAKIAGCKIVLFPKDNVKDYNQAIKECPNLIDDNFKAFPIETFDEALNYLIVK
jgi:ATP-dependent Lon protease